MNLRPVASNLATLAASSLLSVFAAEFALSLYLDRPLRRMLPEVKYQDHAVRWYTHRADQEGYTYGAPFRITKDGFRRNGTELPQASRKVLALGDSFTFGIGVTDNETWPARLEATLNRHAGSYSVINAGVVGYGAFQIDDLVVEKQLLNGTDLVLYALYWNDYMTTAPPKPGATGRISDQGYFRWDSVNRLRNDQFDPTRWLIEHSFILSTLRDLRNAVGPPGPYAQEYQRLLKGNLGESDFGPIAAFLDRMRRLQHQHDFGFAVVILPVYDLLGTKSNYPGLIRDALDKRGIPYLDAFTIFDNMESPSDYFLPEKVDVHLNPKGYDLLATAIRNMLVDRAVIAPK